jgi:hypothetical protein
MQPAGWPQNLSKQLMVHYVIKNFRAKISKSVDMLILFF